VFAFSIAAKLLNAFRGTPLEVDMESLFEKIGRSLEGTVTRYLLEPYHRVIDPS
jgi:hypothetical protein